jgi:hypothetical protein
MDKNSTNDMLSLLASSTEFGGAVLSILADHGVHESVASAVLKELRKGAFQRLQTNANEYPMPEEVGLIADERSCDGSTISVYEPNNQNQEEIDEFVKMIGEIVDHENPNASKDEIYEIIHGEGGLINEPANTIRKKHAELKANNQNQ